MKQITQSYRTGEIKLVDIPLPILSPGQVIVQSSYSAVSLGTEGNKVRTAQKSLVGKAHSRPDLVSQVIQTAEREGVLSTFKKVMNKLDEPNSLGYSSAGTVVAVGEGIPDYHVGDRVACAGENASHGEVIAVPVNLCAPVPSDVNLKHAAFATIGAIALQGIRQTQPMLGETIVVIGLGLLGQLTVQLLKANGCQVIGIDINHQKCDLAKTIGADNTFLSKSDDLQNMLLKLTGGFGSDAVIITAATSSNDPIELAAELCRDRGRVVVVGAVKMDIPREPFYKKELDLRLSRSYGPGRYDPVYENKGIDYPIGYSRWTIKRNMGAFLYQVAEGNVNLEPLITHEIPFDQAVDSYKTLMNAKNRTDLVLGVLFKYNLSQDISQTSKNLFIKEPKTARLAQGQIGVGVVGAGSFSRKFVLPLLKELKNVLLIGLAETDGINAQHSAKKFEFDYYTSDYHQLLGDECVQAIFIATRHNTHAGMVVDALSADKAVYVEKPLAIDELELSDVIEAYSRSQKKPILMVGFNRRFATLTQKLENCFEEINAPKVINYRVNAGFIPRGHWTQDFKIGGGRIIGEVCHFVDLLMYLVKNPICEVYARVLPDQGQYNQDNAIVLISFEDGSIGSVTYVANGDSRMPKEKIEIFAGGKSASLDDFRRLTVYTQGKRSVYKSQMDKGHKEEVLAFVEAIKKGSDLPIPFGELVMVTRATFAIMESLNTGKPISVIAE